MKRAELAALAFFAAGALLTLGVSLPATYAALALFHDSGGWLGAALSVFALLVFEVGAVGAKLATLAIPQWSKRLTLLTVVLLLITTGANYAHGYDLSQAATAAPTLRALLRSPAGAVAATIAAAALFPALLFVFLSAFVAQARRFALSRAAAAGEREALARARAELAAAHTTLAAERDQVARLREQLALERARPALTIDDAARLFIAGGAPESTVRGWRNRVLEARSEE